MSDLRWGSQKLSGQNRTTDGNPCRWPKGQDVVDGAKPALWSFRRSSPGPKDLNPPSGEFSPVLHRLSPRTCLYEIKPPNGFWPMEPPPLWGDSICLEASYRNQTKPPKRLKRSQPSKPQQAVEVPPPEFRFGDSSPLWVASARFETNPHPRVKNTFSFGTHSP